MSRHLHVVQPRRMHNGVYLDRSFGAHRRRPLRERLIDALFGVALVIIAVGLLAVALALVVWVAWIVFSLLVGIGHALGAGY